MSSDFTMLPFVLVCLMIFPHTCFGGAGLTVSNVTETKIHVEWMPVLNHTVEKYQVSAYPIKSYGKIDQLNRNEWTFYNSTFRSDLVRLHPGTLYNISVWAVTQEGLTKPATKTTWTEVGEPDEPPPVEILKRDGEIMSINLPVGHSDKGPVTGYYVVPVEQSPIIVFNQEEISNFSMAEESGLPFYITAHLTPEEANQTFTIGDKKVYNGFYNAPLSKDRKYEVIVGVVSSLNGVTKVAYSSLKSTTDSQEMSQDVSKAQTSSTLSVILSAAIGVFGFLLVISVIVYFFLRKRYGKRRPSDEMVLRVHGADGLTSDVGEYYQQEKEENGFIFGMLHIAEDADLDEVYEKIQEDFWQIPRNYLDIYQTVLGIGQFGEVREGAVRKPGSYIDSHQTALGIGQFGDVRDSVFRRHSQPISCIIHCVQAPTSLMDKERRSFLCELSMMSRVGLHTNVVEFLGASDERDVLHVAIEHHPTSLRGLLLRSRQQPGMKVSNLSEPLLLELASGIAQGMAHLADKGIFHRHLSTRNVLIDEGSIPKVAHFGLGHYNPLGKKFLYTRWTAPEVQNMNVFTSKSDVWSFGVLLWEIMTLGGSPYYGLSTRDILPRIMQGMRLHQPKGVYDELYQVMLHCWELDSDERPKFMELATTLQSMILNAKTHINFQDCINYQYEKFDPSAEDQ